MPQGVIDARRLICAQCPHPCEPFTRGRILHDQPGEWCPFGVWHAYGRHTAPLLAPPATRFRPGTAIKRLLGPIARLIDAALGTQLSDCAPCARRAARLDQMFARKLKPARCASCFSKTA